MIGWIACAAIAQSATLIPIVEPGASSIAVQAVIRLSEAPRDLAAAEVMCETLAEETDQYSRSQIRAFCGQTGRPPRVTLMPDHIRVDMEFPKGQLDVGVLMMASVLRAPSFPEAAVAAAVKRLENRKGSIWQRGLFERAGTYDHVTRATVVEAHRRLFRPENAFIAFQGDLGSSSLEEAWGNRSEGWPAASGVWRSPSTKPATAVLGPDGPKVVELSGPEFAANDAALAIKLLAVYSLGVGKGSAMFRVLREREGWSYRQEACFWPTPAGLRIRLLVATDLPHEKWPKAMRAALRSDVEAWTENDLKRAAGLARAQFERGIGPDPFYVTPYGPAGEGSANEAFRVAYWTAKLGRTLDTARLIRQFELVRLDELKETALDLLDRSMGRVTR